MGRVKYLIVYSRVAGDAKCLEQYVVDTSKPRNQLGQESRQARGIIERETAGEGWFDVFLRAEARAGSPSDPL